MIWGLVLAAGESKRMGTPKLLLPFRRATVIESVVKNVISSKVDKTVVVLGSSRGQIKEKIRRFPVAIVYNPLYRNGMLSSVRRGLKALPRAGEAAVVVLADVPGVPASVINALIAGFRKQKRGIVIPTYRKQRGHPFLVDLKYREEIMGLSPEIGLRQLILRHPEDILEVEVSTAAILQDIDTAEDYRRATRKRRRGSSPRRD
jgi:molybdenum cofactor cytidylyltransferase